MRELEREFCGYAMAQAHPIVRACMGAGAEDNVLKSVGTDVQRIDDPEFAKWHGRNRSEFGVAPEMFNNRLMQFGPVRIIAGIRFRNRDNRFPFISIEQSNIPIGTMRKPVDLLRELGKAFAPFRPNVLSFFHPAHLPLRIAGAEADYHVLMASARTMVDGIAPRHCERVELTPAADLGFYERYTALYDDIFEERPWARGRLRVEDRASLQACLAERLVFEVRAEGVWCGIIAGIHSARGGVDGIEIVDMILARSARGAGFGVAAQWRFADLVYRSDPSAVIWGTISDANTPMLKTAGRAGRVEIGAVYEVRL